MQREAAGIVKQVNNHLSSLPVWPLFTIILALLLLTHKHTLLKHEGCKRLSRLQALWGFGLKDTLEDFFVRVGEQKQMQLLHS